MAIPIRRSLTCPSCGATEDVTIADTSVGPAQRHGTPRGAPSYSLLPLDNWPQTRRDGEVWISCAACGGPAFITLRDLATGKGPRP